MFWRALRRELYYDHHVTSCGLTFKITILLGRNKNIEDQIIIEKLFHLSFVADNAPTRSGLQAIIQFIFIEYHPSCLAFSTVPIGVLRRNVSKFFIGFSR